MKTSTYFLFLFGAFSSVLGDMTSTINSTLVHKTQEVPLSTTTLNKAPSVFVPLVPTAGKISLEGLDSRKQLTKTEALFLETTVQEVLNKIYQENHIDLVAGSVSVSEEAVEDVNNNNDTAISSFLRGAGRMLSVSDIEMCPYEEDKKISGCVFDINLYIDPYCWLCKDDDDDWHPDMFKEIGCHMCLDDDDFGFGIADPTRAPTPAPSAGPSPAPSRIPTEAPESEEDIGLEIQRGPGQPDEIFVHPPPSSRDTSRRRRRPKSNPNLEILKQLRQSPFRRFRKVKKVRFGGRN